MSTGVKENCPFCTMPPERIILKNECGVAVYDGFPVAEGHALVIPRIHVRSIYELMKPDQAALWSLVAGVRDILFKRFNPDGFNIGLNDGDAAGQTIDHAHIHIIPRRRGDVKDPRGGVRWVMPEKAKYW
ncbi:MAG: HIT family protein [Acidobacteriota bacterium]|jgi:diadenosine tetraphosphate (Ap4A) HIT family hydrolase